MRDGALPEDYFPQLIGWLEDQIKAFTTLHQLQDHLENAMQNTDMEAVMGALQAKDQCLTLVSERNAKDGILGGYWLQYKEELIQDSRAKKVETYLQKIEELTNRLKDREEKSIARFQSGQMGSSGQSNQPNKQDPMDRVNAFRALN